MNGAPVAQPSPPVAPATAELAQPLARLLQAANSLGLLLTDTQAQRLLAYLALLQRWNKVYNLTALREPELMFSHHLLDCLAVLPALDRHLDALVARQARVLDVGSGGGLPGVVLAILRPQWQVDCVDAVAKKVGFIRQVSAELGLSNLQGLHARVEALPVSAQHSAGAGSTASCSRLGYQLITSRAFASLADFVRLTSHLLSADGQWAAMKAQPTEQELAAVPAGAEVFHVEQLQVPGLQAQRCLVWMRPSAQAPG